jgi:hypothetical protein
MPKLTLCVLVLMHAQLLLLAPVGQCESALLPQLALIDSPRGQTHGALTGTWQQNTTGQTTTLSIFNVAQPSISFLRGITATHAISPLRCSLLS